MNIVEAVILGLVEGITEYLPVSSTGHLIIAADLLGLKSPEQKNAVDAFNVVVQGGAILAVLGLYWPRFVQMLRGLIGKDPAGLRLFINVVVAFIPAAAVGVLIHSTIKRLLFYPAPVVTAFIVGGIFMILVSQFTLGRLRLTAYHGTKKSVDDMTLMDALCIGLLQILSMWPGTSRSMMTITGGLMRGLRPAAAAEFSFLLGMPTLLAATLLELYKDYKAAHPRAGSGLTPEPMFYEVLGATPVLVGLLVAAVSAAVAVRWLVRFLNRNGLEPFGIYRIVLGITLAGLIVGGLVRIEPPPAPAKPAPALVPANSNVTPPAAR